MNAEPPTCLFERLTNLSRMMAAASCLSLVFTNIANSMLNCKVPQQHVGNSVAVVSVFVTVTIKLYGNYRVCLPTVYVEHLHQTGNQLLLVHAAEPPLLSSSRE